MFNQIDLALKPAYKLGFISGLVHCVALILLSTIQLSAAAFIVCAGILTVFWLYYARRYLLLRSKKSITRIRLDSNNLKAEPHIRVQLGPSHFENRQLENNHWHEAKLLEFYTLGQLLFLQLKVELEQKPKLARDKIWSSRKTRIKTMLISRDHLALPATKQGLAKSSTAMRRLRVVLHHQKY